ncbi:MAG: hypothetical protein LBG64_02030 [Pseudomonadales bacterium]|jgi:hypothetical protein|nr:hypothetical protein [Pseudomonadales bacterium]
MSQFKVYLVSFGYVVGQLVLGLLLHPYQTMQSIVRGKYFSFFTLTPLVILIVLIPLWRFLVFPIFDIFDFAGGYFTELIKFFVVFFCLQWQALLGYLCIKFWLAFRD